MNNRKTIQDELNELNSGLNPNPADTPYSVPEGYFEGFAASVMAKINSSGEVSAFEEIAQLSPLLAGISRTMLYSVPEDYFQSNLDGLQAFTGKEESVVLSFIDKEMPYEVPAGYFANVPEQVLNRVANRGKLVPLVKRKWVRLAVAAMLTGVITLSGIAYLRNGGNDATGRGSNSVPVAVELKKASTEELKQFINNDAVTVPDHNLNTAARSSKTDRKDLFGDVSDKELEAFLKQVPTEDEEIDLN